MKNVDVKFLKSILQSAYLPDSNKSIYDSGSVVNIDIKEKDILLDISINNPTHHYKNKLEEVIRNSFKDIVEYKLQINFLLKENKNSDTKLESVSKVKNIIAVCSGKGGVGKSTITANLAVALSKLGNKVGIIDADIYGPSMHIMFGIEDKLPHKINVDGRSYMHPVESHDISILSIGFFAKKNEAMVWRGPMASKALSQMIVDAYWGELDYLLIDLPPGTGDIHLSLVQAVPVTGAIVVSTPQPIALADARKAVGMFKMDSINVPIIGIVENMSFFVSGDDTKHYIFGKEGAKDLANELSLDFLSSIPLVEYIRECADNGQPAVNNNELKIAEIFEQFAKKVINKVDIRNDEYLKTETVKITHSDGCSNK